MADESQPEDQLIREQVPGVTSYLIEYLPEDDEEEEDVRPA